MRTHILAFPFLLIALLGCNVSDGETNREPVIQSINIDSADILKDGRYWISAVVTDPDGDRVTIFWTSTGGTILTGGEYDIPDHNPTTNPGRWQAPSIAGNYTITCVANDGRAISSKTITVTVK
jgi:hypothetical protein